jgi:hypothetical protein
VFKLREVAVVPGVTIKATHVDTGVSASTVATTISTKLVDDLPLIVNGSIRSVLTLALIAPETKTAGGFRIGGGQGAGWEMMMDGMPTTSALQSVSDRPRAARLGAHRRHQRIHRREQRHEGGIRSRLGRCHV